MNKTVKTLGLIGLILVIAASAAVIFSMILQSTFNIAARDSFITAFGGAAFAYIFVRLGELFTRLSSREKLDQDTVVSLEYVLNMQLNDLGNNIYAVDGMITNLESAPKGTVVLNMAAFAPIHKVEVRLQDLKNVDLINDCFGYIASIDKIVQDLAQLQKFVNRMNDQALRFQGATLSAADFVTVSSVLDDNKAVLIEQLSQIRPFINQASDNALELIAKVQYLQQHPSLWLSLPIPWNTTRHYNHSKMDPALSKIRSAIKRGVDENVRESQEKIAKAQKEAQIK